MTYLITRTDHKSGSGIHSTEIIDSIDTGTTLRTDQISELNILFGSLDLEIITPSELFRRMIRTEYNLT